MKKDLYSIFHTIGIYRHRVAGAVFLDAIRMAAEDPSRLEHINKDIYEPVARLHGSTVSRVSKNIRDVRDTIMKNHGAHLLEQMTGCKNWYVEPPYPNELIEIFARYIRKHHIPYDSL